MCSKSRRKILHGTRLDDVVWRPSGRDWPFTHSVQMGIRKKIPKAGTMMMFLTVLIVLITMLNAWFAFLNITAYYAGPGSKNYMYLAIFQILVIVAAIHVLLNM